eukprot:1136469-Pelagomonas_calceolata.AAC.1
MVLSQCWGAWNWTFPAANLASTFARPGKVATRSVVWREDLNIHSREPSCWTAQVLDAFRSLRCFDSFVQAVRQGTPFPIQEFTDDLRHRFWAVWRDVEGVNPRDTYNKLATSVFFEGQTPHVT